MEEASSVLVVGGGALGICAFPPFNGRTMDINDEPQNSQRTLN